MRSIVRRSARGLCAGAVALVLPLGACVTTVQVDPARREPAAADAGGAQSVARDGWGRDVTPVPLDGSIRSSGADAGDDGGGCGMGVGPADAAPIAYWPTTGTTGALRPISGGTLAVSADQTLAIASDPDRDQVWFVDLSTHQADALSLTAGDEPGRIAEDGAHRAHVVLRSAGAIADIDLHTHALIARRAVCAAPRGIAYDPEDDTLRVACVDGSLVTLPAAGGAVTQRFALPDDLRDVAFDRTNHRLDVTRFRSATLLVVDPTTGAVVSQMQPQALSLSGHNFVPDVAWRMIPSRGGESVLMLHQYAAMEEICPSPGGYGGSGESAPPVVMPAVTIAYLTPGTSSAPDGDLSGLASVVDIAVAPDGTIAVAHAGAPPSGTLGNILAFGPSPGSFRVPLGQVVAVAYGTSGTLVAQTRDPAMVYIDPVGADTPVMLGPALPHDTGQQIFQTETAGGLACAGCHPEGGDDGHVWNFGGGLGPRRTQNLRGGVLATAPFHWDGRFANVPALLTDVFHGRMSGPALADDQSAAVQRWLDTIPAIPHAAPADTAAVARGQALFNDPTILCATCHAGPHFTNNATVDVGTGGAFQVPSLVGVAFRAPYMHNGCAATLHDRFTATAAATGCDGGDLHGHISGLSSSQVDDLVAYLQTL